MKLFDKKSLILLISVVSINLLCIISVSYAYFTAQIKGNEDAKEMTVHAGTMTITYADTNTVSLDNAIPGDSVTKTFKVENTGTLDAKYNIKIDVNSNDFKDKKDLIYTLTKNGSDALTDEILPYEDGYISINNEIKSRAIDTYSLKVMFKNDLEDINQNDNANKKADFTIVVDSNDEVTLYEYEEPLRNNFYNKMISSEDTLYDDYNNLRYVGAKPANYIWFNCDNYENLTQEKAQTTCEKWQIIGLFKDITKADGTKEDLIKIRRTDIIGSIAWDNSGQYGTNNWTTASLQKGLNGPYLNNEDSAWITSEEYTGSSSRANTIDSSYKSITPLTFNMIENVKWNIGANDRGTTIQYYNNERGTTTCASTNSCPGETRDTVWNGKIALIYPSDYGYATSGSSETTRETCLSTDLYSWGDAPYRTDCAQNSWILGNSAQWTLTADASSSILVRKIIYVGYVYSLNGAGDYSNVPKWTLPSLYLKSNVQITNGKGTNEEPYIINA